MTVTIGDNVYTIQFQHATKLGKRPSLRKAPVKAMTTCVIVVRGTLVGELKLIAIGNAICSERDNFSRRRGRIIALSKAVAYCGALKDVAEPICATYAFRTIPKSAGAKKRLSPEAIAALKNTPAAIDKRQRRQKFGRCAQ